MRQLLRINVQSLRINVQSLRINTQSLQINVQWLVGVEPLSTNLSDHGLYPYGKSHPS